MVSQITLSTVCRGEGREQGCGRRACFCVSARFVSQRRTEDIRKQRLLARAVIEAALLSR